MEQNEYITNKFPSSDFALLLFSHLKLNEIEKVDIMLLADVLTDLYYVNDTNYVLEGFNLRETKTHGVIVDIDPMLMDAYFLGYVRMSDREILLNEDYIKEEVIPHYDRFINDAFKYIAKKYVELVKDKTKISNRIYVGDLFYKCNFSRRKTKEDKEDLM